MKTGTLSQEQSEYPASLTQWLDKDAPVQLSYIGNIEILKQPLLGLFSSVKCPASLILRAHDLAQKLSESRTTVISGFHSPVEKEILSVLLRGKGPLVFCPARGLVGMRIPVARRQKIERGQLLVISLFPAYIKRPTSETVIERNRLVANLASELLVIHADPGGKVESLVKEFLSSGKKVQRL